MSVVDCASVPRIRRGISASVMRNRMTTKTSTKRALIPMTRTSAKFAPAGVFVSVVSVSIRYYSKVMSTFEFFLI